MKSNKAVEYIKKETGVTTDELFDCFTEIFDKKYNLTKPSNISQKVIDKTVKEVKEWKKNKSNKYEDWATDALLSEGKKRGLF